MPPSFSYAQSPSYYGYSPAPSTEQYSYGTSGASGSGSDYYGTYTDPPGMHQPAGLAPTAPPGGLVRTEQRGVLIREISRRASQAAVDKLLRDTAVNDAALIVEITIPVDKDRNPRGWATMMFSTTDAALRMINRINKIEFKGRRLSAKIFKEGEAVSVEGSASGKQHHHHQKDNGKKDRKDKGGSSSKWFSSKDDSRKDKDKKDSKKSVVIAHGSSYVKGKR
ncbi:hypothetical protein UCRPA7_1723 [Phaeoacremonium minimum UCRPA7]|uniref:RRM domain-containing protein n=1 Tax=Phaeoacremonium minimum (strain UCR-PA7) TaxID=1286976 RepID=R8BTR2_PHAM7|nr:hypothetical protein UCRPA7_1723 [Phaeoacremonium minimum UCRPA7]EOO02756.1 hypothetical protein UCRPA7_1723 [Phaeoacremonium minimum UCRPA7]